MQTLTLTPEEVAVVRPAFIDAVAQWDPADVQPRDVDEVREFRADAEQALTQVDAGRMPLTGATEDAMICALDSASEDADWPTVIAVARLLQRASELLSAH